MSQPNTAIVPSWTWGSSASLVVEQPQPAFSPVVSAQLAQVSLPEPAVCTVYFQVTVESADPRDVLRAFTLNLNQGVGRVTIPRQITFPFQPAVNAPLEYTIPFIPVHALNVDCSATVDTGSPSPNVRITVYMELSPLTRIPQKQQQLAFGMALPGEADDLDDDLREDLEAEGPTTQQIMMAGREHALDGSDGLEQVEGDDGEADEEEAPELTPVQRLALALTERLGRRPTRIELRQAIVRVKRRRRRGA